MKTFRHKWIKLVVFTACVQIVLSSGVCAVELKFVRPFSNPHSATIQSIESDSIVSFSDEIEYLFLLVQNNESKDSHDVTCTVTGSRLPGSSQFHDIKTTIFSVYSWLQLDRPTLPPDQDTFPMVHVPELLIPHPLTDLHKLFSIVIINGITGLPIEYNSVFLPNLSNYFCIKLHMPNVDARSKYHLVVSLSSNGTTIANRLINIDVIPRRLPEHSKIRGIYYMGASDRTDPNFVTNEVMYQQMKDIYDHGFNCLSIVTHPPDPMKYVYSMTKKIGFDSKILFSDNIQKDYNNLADAIFAVTSLGGQVFVGGVDEPNKEYQLKRQIAVSREYHASGYKVWTSIRTDIAEKLSSIEPLDWINHHYDKLLYDYTKRPQYSSNAINTYYWQMYLETPVLNRYLSGFFLYFSKLDGILPFVYRYVFQGDSPWLIDVRDVTNMSGTRNRKMKYFYCTYPTMSGPITTLQWEAFVAGEQDLKYCFLIEEIVNNLEINGQIELANRINDEFGKRLGKMARFYPANRLKPYLAYEQKLAEEIDMLRNWIIVTWKKHAPQQAGL